MIRVVIVGGGVIGLFCAVRLVKAGARVTVLEAEAEEFNVNMPAASAAAAGMLSPFGEASSAHDTLALASLRLWREQARDAAWADGVRFDGGVIVAATEADAAALQARVMHHNGAVNPLRSGQFKSRTNLSAKPDHALFVEDEGVADPLRVLSGLTLEAKRHGVIVRYARDVAHVERNLARTHDGEAFEADVIVLAPGVWATDALMAAAPALRRVQPAKGHLAGVTLEKPLEPNLHAPGFYLSQRSADVVIGATMEWGVFDRHVDKAQVATLFAAASAVLPGAVAATGRAWAGVRPMSPDGWPMIGPDGAGLIVAAGHSRNGWLLAPLTAEIVTAYVSGAEIPPHWAALSPRRFDT